MTLINLWLVLQQICNTACSHSGSRPNFDYSGAIVVIICLVLNTYRTTASSTTSLKLMLSLSRSGVDSSCPLFGTTVVVVSLVLDTDRAANYSTASLKLMPSHLCSGLNTNCPC